MEHPLETAIEIAVKAHRGQVDKAGKPYILHPLRLMLQMADEMDMMVAVLHDVLEDSDVMPEELVRQGIPREAVEAVRHLSRKADESYEAFITRASENERARTVKIADLEDNMNLLRMDRLSPKDLSRIERYHASLMYLKKRS